MRIYKCEWYNVLLLEAASRDLGRRRQRRLQPITESWVQFGGWLSEEHFVTLITGSSLSAISQRLIFFCVCGRMSNRPTGGGVMAAAVSQVIFCSPDIFFLAARTLLCGSVDDLAKAQIGTTPLSGSYCFFPPSCLLHMLISCIVTSIFLIFSLWD